MSHVIVFEPAAGRYKVFGPFESEAEAKSKMMTFWEDTIDRLEKRGEKCTTWLGNDGQCGIETVGDWTVTKLEDSATYEFNPVGYNS